ncbi:MAG: S8 family serine peptidase, partial [Chloroflexota bacterium]|nr:S8 family serine peptidase [Chloroflexota bacterium]
GHADTGGAAVGGTPGPLQTHSGGLSAAEVTRLAQNADQHVIVILRNQHPNLPARGATRNMRTSAIATDQQSVLNELSQVHAPRVRAYSLINAVAATVSSAEEARLRANPAVQSVVPDRMIQAPRQPSLTDGASAASSPPPFIPPCENTIETDPEALQLTNTAFDDASAPQAQSIVTGTGVTVAYIADGIDPNNPDFIRRDGSHVFTDYQDFSGDGPNAPTVAAEAFGDASSIAAQGKGIYSVNDYVNNNSPTKRTDADCPKIRVLGMAPGASIIGLKAFGQNNQSPTSNFVQAIQYAVDHGANVLNESFGSNPYPDTTNDPISLADAAATAAGVTVIASSGDAGTAGTIGSPATDPDVIAVGATTQFRLYSQIGYAGIQLGNGYVDNNISAFSSAGPAYSGRQTVDVVAPGEDGWALCTPNPAIYLACTDLNGNPSPISDFGGTSEAAPLTAGEAALIIQAYRQTHHGADPTPALVKRIIKSTATDLNIPAYEQGAGLINSLKAVQAAESYQDENSTGATAQGDALLVSPGTLAAEGLPNTAQRFTVQVTNSGSTTQTVTPRVKTLGTPEYQQSFTVNLDPTLANASVFTDLFGNKRAYVEQDFTVLPGMDRLDAAIAFDVTKQPYALVRLTLFDPQGRFTAFTSPQDPGFPNRESGYGHVDVRNPLPGTYRAFIYTADTPNGYSGPVNLDVSTSRFVPAGSVAPALGSSATLQPGQTGTFIVSTTTPAQPGDESAQLSISGTTTDAGAVPIILRSLVPTPQTPGPATTTFTGTLTGGNGRADSPGQALTYAFDVPAGLHDLDLGVALSDAGYNLQGTLVDPNGLPIDVQSTVTATDLISTSPTLGQPTGYTNTMQFFRRDPQAGRWHVILFINDNTSGRQTSLPFSATITYNGVRVAGPGAPNDTGITLPQGAPVSVPVTVTNTGNTTKDFFVDPRLALYAPLSLGGYAVDVPLTSVNFPQFFVPTESRNLTIAAEAVSPSVPISMDILDANGAPPFGNPKPAFQ